MTLLDHDIATPTRVDAATWPAIAAVPGKAYRGRIAKSLFERVVRRLPLHVLLPDGQVLGAGGLAGPVMRLRRPEAFYLRVGDSGLVGFGEAFMAGDWESDDVTGVLEVFAARVGELVPPTLQRLRDRAVLRHPSTDSQDRRNQRRNVERHYDLSNELFQLFLDETLTYSGALFEGPAAVRPSGSFGDLAGASRRKVDRLLDGAGVTARSTVLEIGTGWGELAIRAAQRGATVHSITLSVEQRTLAQERVRRAGLDHLVTVDLCDYREVQGCYDAVLSVEMIEAVGYKYWPEYFTVLDRHLAPGGRVGLQAITMPHERMLASRDTFTWIHKYIFPGGLIPSVTAIEQSAFTSSSLRIVDRFAFGQHYAETLRLWRERFEAQAAAVTGLGFDDVFRRMWSLYLAYSEAGFASGYLDVYQFVLEKGR
jgi:cyclopropane-fatty-acyl-phospholipid synthase